VTPGTLLCPLHYVAGVALSDVKEHVSGEPKQNSHQGEHSSYIGKEGVPVLGLVVL